MSLTDRVRIHEVKTLSNDWYVLKKTTFDYQRRDGTWQRQSRETYDRGNGAVLLPYNLATGQILLCRRAIEPRLGFWTVPAGFMELGETLAQGAARRRDSGCGDILHLLGLCAQCAD